MKNAIILHGMPNKEEYYSDEYPSSSNSHWLPWLQKQLLIRDIAAATPEMPHAYNPEYSVWKREFERYDVTRETILVGHSCGAGFLVRWLSENKEARVGKVILVAPWIDPEEELDSDFFDFEIDADLVRRTAGLVIFNSDNDYEFTQRSAQLIADKIFDTKIVNFHEYGHFCFNDLRTEAFPELLAECL